jgi:hypothetical protein
MLSCCRPLKYKSAALRAQLTLLEATASHENAALVFPRTQRRWRFNVSAPTKRRHLSYYFSLPVLVAIVFFLVAQLATRQRAEIVAELADRIAHHEADDATAALRQLAAMPRPPIDVLASAAASPDQEIANEAQLLVSGLLRRWSRQIDNERRVSTVTRQLAELAQSLAAHHAAFSSTDHDWLAATTRRILRLANRMPVGDSPLVAVHCDQVLTSIAASESETKALIGRSSPSAVPPLVTAAAAPAANPHRVSSRTVAELNFAANVDARRALADANPLRNPVMSTPHDGGPATTSIDRSEFAASVEPMVSGVNVDRPNNMSPAAAFQSPWRGEWAHPMFRMLPAMPINGSATDAEQNMPQKQSALVADKEFFAGAIGALADDDSRELLARWLVASGGDVFPLEEELTRRGFGRLSARLVRQLFSDDPAERLRLVDDILTEPGVDARPWLILLSDDSAADVRLLAVTIMATSDDPTLIEKAWQVAINDRDPRIAGLAARLRDRRDGAQRR